MSHRYPPGRKTRHKAKREARRATALTRFDLSATTTLLYPFQEIIPAIARQPRVTPAEPAPWTPEMVAEFPTDPPRRGRLIAFDDDD